MTNLQKEMVLAALGIVVVVLAVRHTNRNIPAFEQEQSAGLTEEHRKIVASALAGAGLPQPHELEILESGFLVATFHGEQPSREAAQGFASKALLAIRKAMAKHNVVSSYRVTMRGPSEGPGVLVKYGSARSIEDGPLTWRDH